MKPKYPIEGPRPDCPAIKHDRKNARATYGCRCPAAFADGWARQAHYVKRKILGAPSLRVSSAGTARRLQALQAIGWPLYEVAARLGVSPEAVSQLSRGVSKRTLQSTADDVRAVYDQLSHSPGYSLRTRGRAEKRGYPPPAAWDNDTIDDPGALPSLPEPIPDDLWVDEVAVAEAVAGRLHRPLTAPERVEVVRRLASAQTTDADIAAWIGLNERSVTRIRHRHGIPSSFDPTDRLHFRRGLLRGA